jgi:CBS domain-containing protein
VRIGVRHDGGAGPWLDDRCMKIEQLMNRDVVTILPETPLRRVAAILSVNRISGAPVCNAAGDVLGVVSAADILRKEEGVGPRVGRRLHWLLRCLDGETAKVEATNAGEAMTAPAVTIHPSAPVAVAARTMIARRINRLPVVSHGELVGIVTRADLVRAFQRSDEELEAEIRDDVLVRALWMAPTALSLSVRDGLVTVSGAVDTEADAEVVERLILEIPGVLDVHADLRPRVSRTDTRSRAVEAFLR